MNAYNNLISLHLADKKWHLINKLLFDRIGNMGKMVLRNTTQWSCAKHTIRNALNKLLPKCTYIVAITIDKRKNYFQISLGTECVQIYKHKAADSYYSV